MSQDERRLLAVTASGALGLLVMLFVLWPAPPEILTLGLITGSLSALTAMGIVLVHRANKIVNFAQASLGAVAAVLAASLIAGPGWSFWLASLAGLVAALAMGGLVAEAGYSLLGNGNGEFAMAVERDWRGWLGPYLLDLVIDLASANEVPNLEAEVLAMNRTMVAMLRSHGCAVLEHDGWNGYRMMIGTGRKGLSWPADDDRPRVLVETPTARWSLEQAAKAAGMQVITCGGPGQNPSCPVLNGRECGLVACADTIVVRSRPGDRNWEMLTRNHSSSHPDIPVVVETSGRQPPSDALENVRVGLVGMNDLPPKPRLTRDDWLGALAVFLLVFLSTFPIVIPFLIFRDVRFALRTSNLIALVMLFISGSWLARHGGHNPLWTGLTMMLLGVVLVGITIALGG